MAVYTPTPNRIMPLCMARNATALKHVAYAFTGIILTINSAQSLKAALTVRYAEGMSRMRRHGPVIAHCTDSEDFPFNLINELNR